MKLIWAVSAERDLDEIFEFIAADKPGAAADTIERIESFASRLASFPLAGRAGTIAETRELPIPGSPFIIIYRVRADEVGIVRVLHGARRWPLE
jgi:addiction module RelE/StbE family toxin